MKLGSTRPTSENAYLSEIMYIASTGAGDTGTVRNVKYGSTLYNGSGKADGGAGEDALIYFIRAWNEDDNTGYVNIYEDVNNNKMNQGNTNSAAACSAGQPNLFLNGSTDFGISSNSITLPSGNWLDLENGMKVVYNNGGNTTIGGLTNNATYYLRKKDANEAYLYTSLSESKTDTELDNNEDITSSQSGNHYLKMVDNDFLTFQAAVGADDVSDDQSPIAVWEWVFPHPLLLRNGFAVKTSGGVNASIGYRNIGQSSPIVDRNAGTDASLAGKDAERFKKGGGETVLRAGLNYGGDVKQFTTGKTEVWGIHGINTQSGDDETTFIYDTTASTSSTKIIAKFEMSRTVSSGGERGAAMLGPINFDPPLLCKDGMALRVEGGCQVMVLYRQIQ